MLPPRTHLSGSISRRASLLFVAGLALAAFGSFVSQANASDAFTVKYTFNLSDYQPNTAAKLFFPGAAAETTTSYTAGLIGGATYGDNPGNATLSGSFNGASFDLQAFCSQVQEPLAATGLYTANFTGGFSTAVQKNINLLYQFNYASVVNSTTNLVANKLAGAAFQYALWELIEEPLDYNVKIDAFRAVFSTDDVENNSSLNQALNMANGFLTAIKDGQGTVVTTKVTFLQSAGGQDLIIYNVPLPAEATAM